MDFMPDAQFPGPDGSVYTVQIYMPCNYCETPLGVDIQRVDPEGQELWLVDDSVPQLEFRGLDLGIAAALTNVVDPQRLKGLLKTTLVDELEPDLLDVILDDFMREEFHKAVGAVRVTR
jgi:hypothetical protein